LILVLTATMLSTSLGGSVKKYLRPKYIVEKLPEASEGKEVFIRANVMVSTNPEDVDSPFVLMPRKDPAAFVALITYARYCEPELGLEILKWLEEVAKSEPVFGTQGIRNWVAGRLRSLTEVTL